MQINFEEFDGRLNPDFISTRMSNNSETSGGQAAGTAPLSAFED